jgi:hypothetical protein
VYLASKVGDRAKNLKKQLVTCHFELLVLRFAAESLVL